MQTLTITVDPSTGHRISDPDSLQQRNTIFRNKPTDSSLDHPHRAWQTTSLLPNVERKKRADQAGRTNHLPAIRDLGCRLIRFSIHGINLTVISWVGIGKLCVRGGMARIMDNQIETDKKMCERFLTLPCYFGHEKKGSRRGQVLVEQRIQAVNFIRNDRKSKLHWDLCEKNICTARA